MATTSTTSRPSPTAARSDDRLTLPATPPGPTSEVASLGEWHPTSRDLAAELPVLLDAVWSAGYDTFRVIFCLDSWDAPPRHLTICGRRVMCGGFHTEAADKIDLLDAWGRHRLTLTVIRPDATG